jgi:hypothetical protein
MLSLKRFAILVCVGLLASAVLTVADWERVAAQETDSERRERLEQQLQQVERQILTQRRLVEDKQLERQSLERDVEIIEGQIQQVQYGIKARSLAIEQLEKEIKEKEEVLDILTEKSKRQKRSLASLVQSQAQMNDVSLVELLLSQQQFSEFFSEYDSFRVLQDSLQESLDILRQIKHDTTEQKNQLEEKQLSEAELRRKQEMEKAEIERQEAEKERLLAVTRGEERAYQELLQAQERTASELRTALFQLLGGGGAIPFPEAVSLAQYASGKTGVSASLILAILEQETNLGANLGGCVYNDTRNGTPVMHPDRDVPVFRAIANTLGFNPETQQVSCPLVRRNGERIGWGGAMGPSQFIPSTWAIYGGIVNTGGGWTYDRSQDAIRAINRTSGPANPFNNQDAFLATALLLRDNGAASNERLAALRYYAGWGGASRPENQFYGDQVMKRKQRIQREIQILGN